MGRILGECGVGIDKNGQFWANVNRLSKSICGERSVIIARDYNSILIFG